MTMIQLKIITASTRAARKGPVVADWIVKKAKATGKFKVELLDLAVINLPFLDEPEMPNLQKYKHAHTKKWSKTIDKGDAFIIVTPEYNNSYPAPIKNALDHLFNEWNDKPVAFVSYGGVSAGTRSMTALKVVAAALKMYTVKEAVNVPFFETYIRDGVFQPDERMDKSAASLLKALGKWAAGLKKMRKSL